MLMVNSSSLSSSSPSITFSSSPAQLMSSSTNMKNSSPLEMEVLWLSFLLLHETPNQQIYAAGHTDIISKKYIISFYQSSDSNEF